jgi:replicative DNA helicase
MNIPHTNPQRSPLMKTDILSDIDREQDLASYSGEDRVEQAGVVLTHYRLTHRSQSAFKSRLPLLDSILGGFYPGQLWVVSGVTGQGKTTLCQTFTFALADPGGQDCKPLWLSYEMAVDDFLAPFEKADSTILKYIHMPMSLKGNALKWIEDRMIESHLKYQTQVVFIDHIHYLIEMNPRSNMSYIIGETVRGLKQLAMKHNSIIVLVAHTTKVKLDKSEDELGLGDTRDSSFIEQEADVVLYVWRPQDQPEVTVCKVAKNRKKGIINKKIVLVLKDGRYYERQADGK